METITAAVRGRVVTASRVDRANSALFRRRRREPALESFPITGNLLIDKESRNIPIDGEDEKRPPAGRLGNRLLVARKERLRPLGTIPM